MAFSAPTRSVSVACHNNYRTCALFLVPPDHVTCSHSSSSLARDQRHQKTFAEYPAPEVAPAPAWTWWSVPRFPARHYTKVFSCDLPEGQPLAVVTARLSLWRVKPSLDKPDSISSRACSGGGFL